jgi:hypothetical protein
VLAPHARSRIWRGGASLGCALIGLALALISGACPQTVAKPPPPAPTLLDAGGVHVERLQRDAVPMGPRLQGRAGDWLLQSDAVKLVVGGPNERGALLDLVARQWESDELSELRPVVFVDGKEELLELGSIGPREVAGRAALRIVHVARARGLVLVTDLQLIPGRAWVQLSSSIKHVGQGGALSVKLGDRVSWLGRAPFAPGVGFVDKARVATLPWFARGGSALSYALIFPDAPAEVSFVTTLRGPTEQVATGPERQLSPGQVVSHRRLIAVTPGELPAVAKLAWRALGIPTGIARGRLEPAPEWARLVARDPAGQIVIEADVPKDGRFELPLPAAAYRVELLAPGGSDIEQVTIAAGRESPLAFIVPEAARIAYRVMDEQGRPIAARVVLTGIEGTQNPELGPVHLASGAGNVAYTRGGGGVLAVPPGRYRVLVTGGIEYTIAELKVDVGEKKGATLRAELERIVPTPGWVACDFHLHAEPSGDSEVPLADRVTSLLAEGIEFAAATDHNHVTDYAPAIAALDAGSALVATPGVEITTPKWGHFNAFPYPLDAAVPPYAEVTPVAIFEHVRKVSPSAVVQINHPRMPIDIGYFDLGKADTTTGVAETEGFAWTFDTIEVFNGFELGRREVVQKNLADWYALLNLGRIYTAVGNSDSHTLIWQWTGYPRTYVETTEPPTSTSIAQGLKAGRALVTTGPFIEVSVEGGGPGARVKARQGKVKVDLSVRAAPWIDVRSVELLVDGQVRTTFPIAPEIATVERIRTTQELSLERDAWIIVLARGEQDLGRVLPGSKERPFGFTNPVFVDVDGDGNFTASRASQP